VAGESSGIARKSREHLLRDILGAMRIATATPERREINQIEVALDELGERLLRARRGVMAKKCRIIAHDGFTE
jgi:hypothetical protein